MEPNADLVRVLLIDDDQDDYILTRELLTEVPGGRFHLEWTPAYADGVAAVGSGKHDVYLVDYRLGAKTGIDLLRETRGRARPVILFTGQGHSRTDVEALDAGADDYLEKPG